MDSQRAIQQLQQNTGVPQSTTGLTMDALPNSAHPVQFMNFSHYFNGNPGTSTVGHLPAGQATGVGGGRR
jgi:hypothetical protein